jgi:8-oxo-dGTP pyrophosphatase MutT (NUDIX family)
MKQDFFNIPVFNTSSLRADFSLLPFLRAVAVIKIKYTDKFVVYSRQDGIFRFPGGHQEEKETAITTAIRETEEEIGLTGLIFLREIGSCHIFYDYKNKLSHLIANYFLFEASEENWQKRKNPEKGIYPSLKSIPEIQKNTWKQNLWVLEKLTEIPLK